MATDEPYRPATPQRVASFMLGLYLAAGLHGPFNEQLLHLVTMLAVPRVPVAGQESLT